MSLSSSRDRARGATAASLQGRAAMAGGPFSPPFGDARSHSQRSQQHAFYMAVAAIACFVFLVSLLKGNLSRMFPDRTLVVGIAALVLLGLCLGVYHVMSTALQSVSFDSLVGSMDASAGMAEVAMDATMQADMLSRDLNRRRPPRRAPERALAGTADDLTAGRDGIAKKKKRRRRRWGIARARAPSRHLARLRSAQPPHARLHPVDRVRHRRPVVHVHAQPRRLAQVVGHHARRHAVPAVRVAAERQRVAQQPRERVPLAREEEGLRFFSAVHAEGTPLPLSPRARRVSRPMAAALPKSDAPLLQAAEHALVVESAVHALRLVVEARSTAPSCVPSTCSSSGSSSSSRASTSAAPSRDPADADGARLSLARDLAQVACRALLVLAAQSVSVGVYKYASALVVVVALLRVRRHADDVRRGRLLLPAAARAQRPVNFLRTASLWALLFASLARRVEHARYLAVLALGLASWATERTCCRGACPGRTGAATTRGASSSASWSACTRSTATRRRTLYLRADAWLPTVRGLAVGDRAYPATAPRRSACCSRTLGLNLVPVRIARSGADARTFRVIVFGAAHVADLRVLHSDGAWTPCEGTVAAGGVAIPFRRILLGVLLRLAVRRWWCVGGGRGEGKGGWATTVCRSKFKRLVSSVREWERPRSNGTTRSPLGNVRDCFR